MLSRKNSLGLMLALAVAGAGLTAQTKAAPIYWDGGNNSWNTAANWSTDPANATPNPAAVPGSADDVTFNRSGNNNVAQTITLDAAQSAMSLTFNNTQTTTINSGTGGAASTLTLGSGGITKAATALTSTINADVILAASQTWSNLTASGSGRVLIVNGNISESSANTNLNLLDKGNGITLNGTSTYTGITTFSHNTAANQTAIFTTKVLADGGVASSIGQSSNAATNLVLANGAGGNEELKWVYSGTGNATTDRLFTMNNFRTSGRFEFNMTSAVTWAFTNTGSLVFANNGGGNFILSLAATGNAGSTLDVTPLISNPTGAGGYTTWSSAATNLVLRNPNNSFTGYLAIADNGRLEFTNIANSGSNSALGTGAVGNTINLTPGVVNGTRTFRQVDSSAFAAYDGLAGGGDANSSTNRTLAYSPTAGNTGTRINIENNSANRALTFAAGTFTQGGASAGIISFGGTNTGANSFNRAITNQTGAGTPANSVRKDGTGTWSLTGVNTYSGGTTVNQGKLLVNNLSGSGLGSGIVTVKTGGILGGAGSYTGATTIESGGKIAPGNSPGVLTTGDFTMNAGGIYDWEYQGNATPQYDQTILAAGKTLSLAGKWTLNLINLGGTPTADPDTRYYIFTTAAAGLLTGQGVTVGGDVQLTLNTDYAINYGTSGYGSVRVYADDNAGGDGKTGIYLLNVPEPTSLSLLGLGAAGLLLRRRRKA